MGVPVSKICVCLLHFPCFPLFNANNAFSDVRGNIFGFVLTTFTEGSRYSCHLWLHVVVFVVVAVAIVVAFCSLVGKPQTWWFLAACYCPMGYIQSLGSLLACILADPAAEIQFFGVLDSHRVFFVPRCSLGLILECIWNPFCLFGVPCLGFLEGTFLFVVLYIRASFLLLVICRGSPSKCCMSLLLSSLLLLLLLLLSLLML